MLKTMARAAIIAMAEASGLPYAPIMRPADLLEDPHLLASGGLAQTRIPGGGSVRLPILPLDLDGRRLPKRLDPPRLGEQGHEILAGLGYSDAEIDPMSATGSW